MKHVALVMSALFYIAAMGHGEDLPQNSSRGQAWIESHPFTINAMIETPFKPEVHREIGFTSVFGYHSLNSIKLSDEIFSTASKNKMPWHMFSKWEPANDTKEYIESINKFRQTYKGNIGISVGDECDPKYFAQLAPVISEVRKIAPDALVYHAVRGIDFNPEYIKPGVYEAYVDKVIKELKPDVLMFDMYPFYRKGLAEHFFRNFEVVTTRARKAGIPCMNWLQGHAFQETNEWPQHEPSESEINLQAYVSLAYGCKGLSYWTYGSHYFPYGKSITDPAGDMTSIGQNIKNAIPKIKVMGEALKFLTNQAVYYVPSTNSNGGKSQHIPLGVKTFDKAKNEYISDIKVSDGQWGFLVSFFTDRHGGEYVMVVNCNQGYKKTSQSTKGDITIKFTPAVKVLEKLNLNTGKYERVELGTTWRRFTIDGGMGELFRINYRKAAADDSVTLKYNHKEFWQDDKPVKTPPANESAKTAEPEVAGAIGTIMIVGNSIAWHPPRADIGWQGDWGMAATAQDKDYAHQLYKHFCEFQPKPTPKLDVRSYIIRSLTTNPELTKQITSSKADIVVIQIGDNISDEEANEKNVTEPFVALLKELQKTNPQAKIFVASTYGGSAKVDSLLEKAQVQSRCYWISLKGIVQDRKNQAISEGHFTHAGVNWHPGDYGMKTIANVMWAQIKPQLKK